MVPNIIVLEGETAMPDIVSNTTTPMAMIRPPTPDQRVPESVIPPLVPAGTDTQGLVISTGVCLVSMPISDANVSDKQVA
mmetsp:Transcript_15473/g.37010  ORF Transcript_15473/g.37010 Transcript_15473/m.37010 type:complete len:80 (-) Transcript_15473:325-564(-)